MQDERKQLVIKFAKRFLASIHIKESIQEIVIQHGSSKIYLAVIFKQGDHLIKLKEGYRRRFENLFEALGIYARFGEVTYEEEVAMETPKLSVLITERLFFYHFERLMTLCQKIVEFNVLDFIHNLFTGENRVESVNYKDSQLIVSLNPELQENPMYTVYYFSIAHTVEAILQFFGLTPMGNKWYIDNTCRTPQQHVIINFPINGMLERSFSIFRTTFLKED